MSIPVASPIARFDCRVRIAATLLRAAPRAEHLVFAGMALAATAAAWPFAGRTYPLVAVPSALALAALVRHHLDGLDDRRAALAAAGARPADTRVIQSAGPIGAAVVGAVGGIAAAVLLGRPAVHALVPLVVGFVASLLVRRTWLGAPALGAGSVAALGIAFAEHADVAAPAVGPRAHLVAAQAAHAVHSASAWSAAWPVLLAAVLVPAAAQAAIAHRTALGRLVRRPAAAALRRLTARSSA